MPLNQGKGTKALCKIEAAFPQSLSSCSAQARPGWLRSRLWSPDLLSLLRAALIPLERGHGAVPWAWGSAEMQLEVGAGAPWAQAPQSGARPRQAPAPRQGLHLLWMDNFCWLTGVLGRSPFVKLMTGRSCLGQRLSNDLLCDCSANITKEPKSLPSSRAPWGWQCSNAELFLLPEMNLTGSSFFHFLISNYRIVLEHADFIISFLRTERSETFPDIGTVKEFDFRHCWLP